MGGLGNQMLQYAIGRNLAIKNELEPLWLDLSWYQTTSNDPFFRKFELHKLNTTYQPVDHKSIMWKLRFTNHLEFVNPFKYKKVIEKQYASFDETILQSGNNILLQGFFPSYKYFEGIREILQKEFVPKSDMNSENLAALHKIKSAKNSVSVHFRRGDYALTGIHGILDKSYYERALKHLATEIEDIELFIFSDEPEWVEQNMHFEFPFHIMDFNKGECSYFDLELMKNCKHNIIANSTFSWWAAWLNSNPQKKVVAPLHWLNVDINKMQNIPEEWVVI
jgi:hypothetical protein